MIIRLLQGIGCLLNFAESSHSNFNRRTSLFISSNVNTCSSYQFSSSSRVNKHAGNSVIETIINSSCSLPFDNTNSNHIYQYSTIYHPNNNIISINNEIINSHILANEIKLECSDKICNSYLDFIINLIAQLSSITEKNYNLSHNLIVELRCSLLSLLVQRYIINLQSKKSNNIESIDEFRLKCKNILESTCAVDEDIGLDLRLWNSYILGEISLSNNTSNVKETEGYKLCDKMLYVLSQHVNISSDIKTTSEASMNLICNIPGSIHLYATTFNLALIKSVLSPSLSPSLSSSSHPLLSLIENMKVPLLILVAFAEGGRSYEQSLLKNNLCNENKSKKINKIKNNNLTSEKIFQSCSNLRSFAMLIIEKITLSINKIKLNNIEDSKKNRHRLHISNCNKIDNTHDIFYLIVFLSWLEFFNSLFFEYEKTSSSSIDMNRIISRAIKAGDEIFVLAIDLLKNSLISSPIKNTNKNNSLKSEIIDNVKGYKNYLSSNYYINKQNKKIITNKKLKLAEIEYLGISSSCSSTDEIFFDSEFEIQCLISIERLYIARVMFLQSIKFILFKYKLEYLSFENINIQISDSIKYGIEDFPLSVTLLNMNQIHELVRPGGLIRLYSSIRNCNRGNSRFTWGGGIQTVENIYILNIYIHNANKDINNINNLDASLWSLETSNRIINIIETILNDSCQRKVPIFWQLYFSLLINRKKYNEAKKIFYRAIQHCSSYKFMWINQLLIIYKHGLIDEKQYQEIIKIIDNKGIKFKTN
jgi:hypothetical protein